MNRHNHWLKVFVLLTLAAILGVPVSAAGAIDPEKDVSLTIWAHYGQQDLPGVEFRIYQVSHVDAGGELTPVEDFARFSQLLDIRGENGKAWEEAAKKLEAYVKRKKGLTPTDIAATDSAGKAFFPSGKRSLAQGLYLVLGTEHHRDNREYTTAPFLVQLPARDPVEDVWNYAVMAEAKAAARQMDEKLAQTGQLIWPVFALAAGGCGFAAVGWLLRKKG